MKCLRCGYCCFHYSVIIVDDPDKGVEPDNLKGKMGVNERCQHIRGDTPGEYICAIHDKDWYPETPCFQHGQVESSDLPCRMGTYILGKGIELTKDWQGSIIMKCPKCKQDVVSEHDRCCSSCDHSFSGAEISHMQFVAWWESWGESSVMTPYRSCFETCWQASRGCR